MAKLFLVSILSAWMALSLTACGRALEVPTDVASDVNEGHSSEPPFEGSNPVLDSRFLTLSDGRSLASLSVSGTKLSLTRGSGTTFSSTARANYESLKRATQSDPNHKVQWTLMDLGSRQVIDKSLSSGRKLFGASSSKIYVGAALLDKQNGAVSNSQLQLMAEMLVVSSNTAWTNLQTQIGDGNANKGRERIQAFTQRMGYTLTRGFQGYWGSVHGNEMTPDEAADTLSDLYRGSFPGAEVVWKLMHTCRTGASRGLKYIPSNVYVGGKTGTYDGATENPATGATYNVNIRNHLLVFYVGGRQLGLAILSNSGSDESAALLAGGLIREHGGLQ